MKYRKRPVVVEAEQFKPSELPLPFHSEHVCLLDTDGWYIETLEGPLILTDGDFVIKGIKGEFYPCKPDIFAATYEEAPDANDKS